MDQFTHLKMRITLAKCVFERSEREDGGAGDRPGDIAWDAGELFLLR